MSRVRRGVEEKDGVQFPELVAELRQELSAGREFGQPFIEELELPKSDKIKATVIWDKWDGVDDRERIKTILKAYEEAEGLAFVERIVLAIGLTVPEAIEDGLLEFAVVPMLRKSDPVSADECRRAMIEQGGSVLGNSTSVQLRFATMSEAEACIERLAKRLPKSEPIWTITKDAHVFAQAGHF